MNTNTAEKINPTATGGMKSILRQGQKPVTEEKKGKTPVIQPSDDVKKLAQQIYDNKRKVDDAQSAVERDTALLIEAIKPIRKGICQKEYVSSLRVPCLNEHSVLVTWSNNYSKIATDQEEALIKIVGDKYEHYFKSKFVISAIDLSDAELYELFGYLSPDGGESEEGLKIGQDRFFKFFKVVEQIKPTERFTHEAVLMPDEVVEDLKAAGVKQYSPAVKIR